MKNTITFAVVLNPVSGDVTNWMFSHDDLNNVQGLINMLEEKYNKPVEVYHLQNCYPDGFKDSWSICTVEQKTNYINANLKNMAYSTQEGFTEYGKSVIKEG